MGSKEQSELRILVRPKNYRIQKNSCCKKTNCKKEKESCCAKEEEKNPRRLVDIGLDISTSIVGVALLDAITGDMIKIEAYKLNRTKFKDVWDKAAEVKSALNNTVDTNKYNLQRIFVEEAHMRFTPGFSSAKTLFTLSRFNGIVSYIGYELFGVKPIMINVRTGRKNLGIKINRKDKSKDNKTKIFEAVKKLHPDFPWVQHLAKTGYHKGKMVYDKHNFDMADAYITAASGQIEYPYSKHGNTEK